MKRTGRPWLNSILFAALCLASAFAQDAAAPSDSPSPADASSGDTTAEDELLAAVARVSELETERDRLTSELADAKAELDTTNAANEELRARIAELEARVAELEGGEAVETTDGEGAQSVEELEAEKAALTERIIALETNEAELNARIAELEAAGADAQAAGADAAPSGTDADELAALKAERDSLVEENDAIRAELDSLMARNYELEEELAALEGEKATLESRISELEGVVAQLEEAARDSETRLAAERGDLSARVASGSWDFDRSVFTKTLKTGFAGASQASGAWKVDAARAAQTDASQYFAKLRMAVPQSDASTLYSFKAVSSGKGWIGIGIHFFASEATKKRSYGEGKSLLIWLTRDREARGDDETYLQLYRSDDAVDMERVFDAEVQADIAKEHLFEILYEPGSGYVAVAIDGTVRAVYKTFFDIDAGATVALRTLGGGAVFSDFSVRVAP